MIKKKYEFNEWKMKKRKKKKKNYLKSDSYYTFTNNTTF